MPDLTFREWSARRRLIVWGVLTCLALGIALLRLRTYEEPVNRDLATYAVIADGLLNGRELYADLWDHKPPAVFWTYALALFVAGRGQQTFYVLTVAASIATMIGIYAAASAWSRRFGWLTGLYGAVAWTVIGGTLPLQANEPNTEAFINACVVWAFALLLRLPGRVGWRRWLWPCAGLGLLLAWASLYKTVVLAHALAFGLALGLMAFAGGRPRFRPEQGGGAATPDGSAGRWRFPAGQLAVIAVAALLPWLGVAAFFHVRGTLPDFLMAVFQYNIHYAGATGTGALTNLALGFHPANLLPKTMVSWLPLLVVALIGPALGMPLSRRLRWPVLALFLYAMASHAAMALPGQFYPHYYQYWGPPLCIGGAWGLFLLQRRFPKGRKVLAAGLLVILVALEGPSCFLTSDQWARRKYGPGPVQERRLGRLLGSVVLRPGETVYQWGSAVSLLWYAGRPVPSGIFFVGPVLGGPFAESATRRLLADLETNRPDLVLIDVSEVPPMPDSPVTRYFFSHYKALGRDPVTERFLLLVRKGSALEVRQGWLIEQLHEAAVGATAAPVSSSVSPSASAGRRA